MAKELTAVNPDLKVVTHAELQSAVRVGLKTETNLNATKIPGVKMYWVKGEGLLCESKNEQVFIPSTNVKFVHFPK